MNSLCDGKTTMSKFHIEINWWYKSNAIDSIWFKDFEHFGFPRTKNQSLNRKPAVFSAFYGWNPLAYPRCNADVILDQTTLRRCLCSNEIMPKKKIRGWRLLTTWLWWLSHQNLEKYAQRTFEKDRSIQLNAIHSELGHKLCMVCQSQRIHVWCIYLHSPEKSTKCG